MEDFIGIFDSQIPDDLCDQIVSYFNEAHEYGFTVTRRQEGEAVSQKDDSYAVAPPIVQFPSSSMRHEHWRTINEGVWDAYNKYASKYAVGITESMAQHGIYEFKIQKTQPGQGYHVWHHEVGNRTVSQRVLFFILYLNDVEDGGETEFLYYHKRVKPKKGTVLIAPAHFTHTHRGNPPLSGDKYIVTGWVEF